jgi:aspartyl-tRNA(Asn)/glutamyl-tRNA(Gln) amidotransferase subunit C
MTLSRDDVDHVAMLARLGLSDEEKSRLLGELEKILGHIGRLQQVDTSMLAETAQVGDLVNVMRVDEPAPTLGTVAALRNAPAADGKYFIVGAIQVAVESEPGE